MATYNLSAYSNILRKRYDRMITDAVTLRGPGNFEADQLGLFQPQTFMEFLRANGRISIGGSLDAGNKQWPVRSAGGSASSYSAEDPIPSSVTDTYAQASIAWARTRNTMEIDNLALEVSRGERVVGDIDAFLVSYENKVKELFSSLEDQLAGNGTGNDMDGFRSFLSDSNTYAGIDQGANAYWQATEVDGGAVDVTRAKLNEVIRDMDVKGSRPTQILMGMTQAQKYAELFTSGIQYPGGAQGQSHVLPSWQGIPVVVINTMNASGRGWDEIFFVNVNDLSLEFVPFRGAPAEGIDASSQTYFGAPVGIDHEPTGKDKRQLVVKAYHRFYAHNPKKHGVLMNLQTSF
jgi:hypothetical protein